MANGKKPIRAAIITMPAFRQGSPALPAQTRAKHRREPPGCGSPSLVEIPGFRSVLVITSPHVRLLNVNIMLRKANWPSSLRGRAGGTLRCIRFVTDRGQAKERRDGRFREAALIAAAGLSG
jgi:hypothetical protein